MFLIARVYNFILRIVYTLIRQQQNTDCIKILLGKTLSSNNLAKTDQILRDIQKAEFKIFSQWGDDGIIQFLISYLDIENENFIEFGVEDYTESNTRFLLVNNNWSGMVMDGSQKNVNYILKDNIYWQHNLLAKAIFITKENVNQLIKESGFNTDIGLLHIDIDGNDYWIWNEINVINPVIVIVEYNSVFGSEKAWTVPYNPVFTRSKAHNSDLYFGTSLKALVQLGEKKGYSFIGSNSNGNNAYFVRNDKMKQLRPLTVAEGYVVSKFRESRNKDRKLTYKSGKERLEIIKGLEVHNVETGVLDYI